ncbi:MAG: N-acetyltransferase family protein [Bdellovibrionales bacterium]
MKIRPLTDHDFPQWLTLWNANNLGHKNEAVTTQTWVRLNNDNSPVCALVAEDKGSLIGLVQYVLHPTTGSVEDVCYMQDVFVDPDHRGKGIARQMIEHLERLGKQEKWARIYWLAEAKNEAAQALYKSLGHKLDFTLHILPINS